MALPWPLPPGARVTLVKTRPWWNAPHKGAFKEPFARYAPKAEPRVAATVKSDSPTNGETDTGSEQGGPQLVSTT